MKNLIRKGVLLALVAMVSSCSIGEWIADMEPLGRMKKKAPEQGEVQITVHNHGTREGYVHFNGYLREAGSNETLLFASVGLYAADELIAGVESNFDGWYSLLIPLDSIPELKTLRLSVEYLGFYSVIITDFQFCSGDQLDIDITMMPSVELHDGFHHVWFYPPLYQPDELSSGQIFTNDQIRRSPTRG